MKKEIESLCVDFNQTYSGEKGFLLFTKEVSTLDLSGVNLCCCPSLTTLITKFKISQELQGVPDSVVSGYPEESGKYHVTFKYPDIFPVLLVLNFNLVFNILIFPLMLSFSFGNFSVSMQPTLTLEK